MSNSTESVQLIPYTTVDGIRTFKDSEIKRFYRRMENDGVAHAVFHAGDVRDDTAFLNRMKSDNVLLYIVCADNEFAGLVWLTHFEDRTCRVHFTAFSEFWGKQSVEIGRAAISQIINMKDKANTEYLFDVLQGLIPSWNTRGIKWLQEIGLETAGTIPGVLWDAGRNASVDGTLLYLTRELTSKKE